MILVQWSSVHVTVCSKKKDAKYTDSNLKKLFSSFSISLLYILLFWTPCICFLGGHPLLLTHCSQFIHRVKSIQCSRIELETAFLNTKLDQSQSDNFVGYLTSMKSDSENKDNGDDDGDDVERNHGDGSSIVALEHGSVTELYQENVDDSHGTKK